MTLEFTETGRQSICFYFNIFCLFFFSFRSYLTPVRDEEAESLRKARSRQARQTRRSTQVKNGNCHVQVKDEESQCAKKQNFFC